MGFCCPIDLHGLPGLSLPSHHGPQWNHCSRTAFPLFSHWPSCPHACLSSPTPHPNKTNPKIKVPDQQIFLLLTMLLQRHCTEIGSVLARVESDLEVGELSYRSHTSNPLPTTRSLSDTKLTEQYFHVSSAHCAFTLGFHFSPQSILHSVLVSHSGRRQSIPWLGPTFLHAGWSSD